MVITQSGCERNSKKVIIVNMSGEFAVFRDGLRPSQT